MRRSGAFGQEVLRQRKLLGASLRSFGGDALHEAFANLGQALGFGRRLVDVGFGLLDGGYARGAKIWIEKFGESLFEILMLIAF